MKFLGLFCVLATLSLCLCACDVRVVDSGDPVSESSGPVIYQQALRPEVRRSSLSGNFEVSFPAQSPEIQIRRTNPDKSETYFHPQGQAWADTTVVSGEIYEYSWGSSGFARVEIPLDFEIKGNMSAADKSVETLFQKKKVARLILRKDSVLTTLGRELIVDADEVIFEDAKIQTFAPGAVAGLGQDGRGGGRIEIRAQRAEGRLRVDLRGEHGGMGFAGPAPTSTMKGREGRGASAPRLIQKSATCLPGYDCQVFQCESRPGAAEDGEDGRMGFPGMRGGHGGDSGVLKIVAVENSLQLEWFREPGHGGRGGPGGEGGAGGRGGAAWVGPQPNEMVVLNTYISCESSAGRDGLQGPRGPEGSLGAEGRGQEVCVSSGNQKAECR